MIRVFVPRDAAAVACGADGVAAAIRGAARRAGLDVAIVRNGSRGMLWLEPLVEVEDGGVRYGFGPLDAGGRGGAGGGAGARGAAAAAIAHPQAVGPVEAIPFLARQTRLTFARCGITDPLSLADYAAHGGWQGLRAGARARAGGDRRRGHRLGAARARRGGVPDRASSGRRWRRRRRPQKYIVCNADEGDSGTFADRMIMEGDPFCLIEGMVIAGIAVGRDARLHLPPLGVSARGARRWRRRSPRREAAGWLGARVGGSAHAFHLEVRIGAGRLCLRRGDLAARQPRGQARHRAGEAAAAGAQGAVRAADGDQQRAVAGGGAVHPRRGRRRPTPTSAWGGRAGRCRSRSPATSGTAGSSRRRSGSRSASSSTRSAAARHSGRPVRAVQVGGPLGAYFPPALFDTAFDYEAFAAQDGLIGHGGIVVFDDTRRHGAAGALRLRLLRDRELRQVHALPDRRGARPRDHGPADRRRGSGGDAGAGRGSVPHDEVRIALCARGFHPISGDERADAFPRGLRRRAGACRRLRSRDDDPDPRDRLRHPGLAGRGDGDADHRRRGGDGAGRAPRSCGRRWRWGPRSRSSAPPTCWRASARAGSASSRSRGGRGRRPPAPRRSPRAWSCTPRPSSWRGSGAG